MAEKSTRAEARLIKRLEAAEREQQIQSGVDDVLSRALAMESAEDIARVVEQTRDTLADLGLTPVFTAISIFDEDRDLMHGWHAWQDRSVAVRRGYKASLTALRKSGSALCKPRRGRQRLAVTRFNRRQFTSEINKLRKAQMPGNPEWAVEDVVAGFTFPNYRHSFYFSGGLIVLDYPRELTKPEIAVGRRIADAFDVAYRRFVELQAKEQRARDAEIEAALERVRGCAQGMQSSDEMGEVTEVLFKEMQGLGSELQVSMFTLMDPSDRSCEQVVTGSFGSTKRLRCTLEGIPAGLYRRTYLETFDAWARGDVSFVIEIPEQEFHDWRLHATLSQGVSRRRAREWARDRPRGVSAYHYRIFHRYGFLTFVKIGRPLPDEDLHTAHRFTAIFDYAYGRFRELEQKEAQNRELTIQNALERVRARALGMQASDELSEVSATVLNAVGDLGFDSYWCSINLLDFPGDEFSAAVQLSGSKDLVGGVFSITELDIKGTKVGSLLSAFRRQEECHSWEHADAEKDAHLDYWTAAVQRTNPDFVLPQRTADADRIFEFDSLFDDGSISLATAEAVTEEEQAVLRRLTDVFAFAFSRFRELQQKEDQNRELTIQNALERVRARALGMQTSDELGDVTSVLLEQFRGLGHEVYGATIIGPEGWSFEDRTGRRIQKSPETRQASASKREMKHPDRERLEAQNRAQEAGEPWFVFERQGKILDRLFRYYRQGSDISTQELEAEQRERPDKLVFHRVFHETGFIELSMEDRLSDDDLAVAKRFADVFDMAYRRFLELKDKEDQNRELTIQNALERVRARASGMQTSDDLYSVSAVLHEQMTALGIQTVVSAIAVMDHENDAVQNVAMVSSGEGSPWQIVPLETYRTIPVHLRIMAEHERGDGASTTQLEGGECRTYQNFWINRLFEMNPDARDLGWPDQSSMSMAVAYFSRGWLYLELGSSHGEWGDPDFQITDGGPLSDDELAIFKRFADVFDFAYNRFCELKQKEDQNRELTIQNALERVRSRALGMQNSDDISDVVWDILEESRSLGFPVLQTSIILINDYDPRAMWSASIFGSRQNTEPDYGRSYDFSLMRTGPEGSVQAAKDRGDAWHVGKADVQRDYWIDQLQQSGHGAQEIQRQVETFPDVVFRHRGFFPEGTVAYQAPRRLDDDELVVLKRFTDVFGIAYTRHTELQQKEAQNRALELANEQLEQTSLNKSQFLRRMSHDLRSPMNAIIGYTRILRRRTTDRLDAREQRNLANIETSSGNLLNLINDILDLSRIEAGRIEVNLQPMDLRALANECADALASIVKEGVVLQRDLADVGVINSDPDRLRQVVMNLLGNATKFTESGSITLSLRRVETGTSVSGDDNATEADRQADSGEPASTVGTIEFSIADTGIGIPEEDLPHIFDEFHQVERQGGETSEGTGLGLAIAKKTVELLGGEVTATSEVGKGTTFTVRLPS